jgi:hypothetical protein
MSENIASHVPIGIWLAVCTLWTMQERALSLP